MEGAAKSALIGREGVATVRDLLHRYRDEGRLSADDCERVINALEARVSEDANTIPGIAPPSESDDPFTKTTVLSQDAAVAAPADSDERLQVGSVLRDRFLLQERVAGGSMGAVYKALDRRLAEVDGVEPWVAIKVLSPQLAGNAQALRALQQEAAKGRCLTHPNIVRFIDFDREDDLYFIVMEWLEGRSLAGVLDAGEDRYDLSASLEVVRQIGEALSYAHRCGVIHADVKPANVMVLPTGSIKLFDFGIARVRQQQRTGDPGFDPGVLGAVTPAYSSMQVLTGEEPTVADDVFSLACLAYRLVAGHRVFGPRNAAEAAEAGMEPQRPQALSDTQWKALRKALSHSRVARHATTGEFLEALLAPQRTAKREEPLTIPDEAVVERRFEERSRRWPYAVLVLLAAAVGVVFLNPAWVTGVATTAERWLASRGQEAAPPVESSAGPTNGGAEPVTNDAGAADATTDTAPRGAGPGDGASTAAPADDTGGAAPAAESAAGPATASATGDAPAEEAAEAEPAPAAPDAADRASAAGATTASDDTEAAAVADRADEPAESTPAAPAGEPASDRGSSTGGPHGLVLAAPGQARPELDLTLREGGEPANVSVYRWFGLSQPLTVRIDEVGYSGNRSPRDSGQYTLSGSGVLSFDRGQRSVELEIRMPEDSEREADQQVSLLLRDYYNVSSELGVINLSLLDDDQRAFEAEHAANTIAFAQGQVVVQERDPAAQVDVLRLNPDRRTMTIRYRVSDVTATEGEDYFSPSRQSITFGPGQRTARLLIPLVQDSLPERDESFAIELDVPENDSATLRRIAVIIRDDD